MVMVEPVSSSRVALPPRAASARRATSAGAGPEVARLGVAHHRHHQAAGGLRGDADVHRADGGVTMPASSSKRALTCGKLAHGHARWRAPGTAAASAAAAARPIAR